MKKGFLCFLLFYSISVFSQKENDATVSSFQKRLSAIKSSDSTLIFLNNTIKHSSNDLLSLEANYALGRFYYYKKKDYKSAKKLFLKANTAAVSLNEINLETSILMHLGFIAFKNDDSEMALKFYNDALLKADYLEGKEPLSLVFSSMARVYRKEGDTIKALDYYRKSLYYGKGSQKNAIVTYNNLGVLFLKKNKDSAVHYFNKYLKEAEKKKDSNRIHRAYINLGHTYLNYEVSELPSGLEYLTEAEKYFSVKKKKIELYYINFYLGLYYEKMNNSILAEVYYKRALASSFSKKDMVQQTKVLQQVSKFYQSQSKLDLAMYYEKKFHKIKDSIYSVQKNKAFNIVRTKYEVEKKDNQIILLEKEKELSATKRKWIIISAILLALPLMCLFLFYKHRAKAQETIWSQEKDIYDKENARLQNEQELIQIKALVEGQDKERHRIAKELHDGVGGQLASVNLSLSEINSKLKNSALNNVSGLLANSFNELRALSHSLSSNYHKDKTLYSLLLELKKQFASSDLKIEISIYPENSLVDLKGVIKHNLYRIFQESFANILKHAEANNVQLSINKHINDLVVIIEDDGVGFDVETIKKGIGMKNINERIKMLNGKLSIDSSKGNGTQLILEIPI